MVGWLLDVMFDHCITLPYNQRSCCWKTSRTRRKITQYLCVCLFKSKMNLSMHSRHKSNNHFLEIIDGASYWWFILQVPKLYNMTLGDQNFGQCSFIAIFSLYRIIWDVDIRALYPIITSAIKHVSAYTFPTCKLIVSSPYVRSWKYRWASLTGS